MSDIDGRGSVSEIALSHEQQAPPYVLHPHGPPAVEIESLPIYTAQYDINAPITIQELNIALAISNRIKENDVKVWQRYIAGLGGKQSDEGRAVAERSTIMHYFAAITAGQEDLISLLIESNLVTASTKMDGKTPLLQAVLNKNVRVAQQLIELGADPNEFGSPEQRWKWSKYDNDSPTLRTPLQLAASLGHLVLVKILMEEYHCDDSLIAPDGQIALRLAAENGHREVVDYLPARRGGGFRRWKHKNKTSIRRAKRAAVGIGKFGKFFVWDIEMFCLWSVPKHLLVKPLLKATTWFWKHRLEFGPWCLQQLRELPRRIVDAVKEFGKAIYKFGKWFWKAMLEVPRLIKDIAEWTWKILTIRLPNAIAVLARWVGTGLTSMSKVIWNAVLKVVSFFSTVVTAMISFFRGLTLKDIWNGFCDALRAVFVALPRLLWSWILAFGDGSYKMMKLILGELGEVLWYIGYGLLWVVTFIPKKLWVILQSFGAVMAKAGYEVRVWMDPKAR